MVDNTSPARATRKEYLDLVRSEFPGTTVRILHFVADKGLCVHNSLYRAATKGETREVLPMIAFNSYWNGLEVPKASEGEFGARARGLGEEDADAWSALDVSRIRWDPDDQL